MTRPCYDKDYPEIFRRAVEAITPREPHLLNRLNEGPSTISLLAFQLRVTNEDRLTVFLNHSKALASNDPDTVLKAAAALTADMEYLNKKSRAYQECMDILPPKYIPMGRN